jgi:hypothetical protein
MTATTTPRRPTASFNPEPGDFQSVLRAEWTKFRTVRGWLVSLFVATLLCIVFTYLVANGNHTGGCTGTGTAGAATRSFRPDQVAKPSLTATSISISR